MLGYYGAVFETSEILKVTSKGYDSSRSMLLVNSGEIMWVSNRTGANADRTVR